MRRIVIAERISDEALEILMAQGDFEVVGAAGLGFEALCARLADAHALIVRQATRVDAGLLECAPRLVAVARAGAGLDGIDVDAATRRGVVVFSAPDGNVVSAAEHATALMASLARNIPRADRAVRAGRPEEPGLVGVELDGKTLGVVGLGRVGLEVARRALGLGMRVVAHDPFVKEERARGLDVEICGLEELLGRSDFVTLHAALTESSRRLLDRHRVALLRRGARLVHCASPELVDFGALAEALDSGRLAGVALDLRPSDLGAAAPLLGREDVIVTPALAALTEEAQQASGRAAAERVRDFLTSGLIEGAANFPAIPPDRRQEASTLMALAERMGRFLGAVTRGAPGRIEVSLVRQVPGVPREAVSAAAVRGVLSASLGDTVQLVNALATARLRDVEVTHRVTPAEPQPGAALEVGLETSTAERRAVGAVHAGRHRLLAVDDAPVEADLSGHLLFFSNHDRPGAIGRVGTLLGNAGCNIASIHVGRPPGSGDRPVAVGLVTTDQPVDPSALAALAALPEMIEVHAVTLEDPPRR